MLDFKFVVSFQSKYCAIYLNKAEIKVQQKAFFVKMRRLKVVK